jgi:predicted dehydrogenase
MVADGAIGEVLAARTIRVVSLDGVWVRDGWRLASDGGVLLDQGCHFVNLLRRVVGEIVGVSAMAVARAPGWSAPDTAVVVCRFESGALGQQLYTFASPDPGGPEAVVHGTTGSLEVHTGYGQPTGGLLHRRPDDPSGAWVVHGAEYDDTFAPAIADWLGACRNGTEPVMSGREGLRDLEVVAAALRSIQAASEEPVRPVW